MGMLGGNPVVRIDKEGLLYSSGNPYGPIYQGPSRTTGLPGGKPLGDPCGCFRKAFMDWETGAGAGLVAGGQPTTRKRFRQPGTSKGTSPISRGLSRAFPQKLPISLPAPTTNKPSAKSNKVGRILGRWAPIAGWGVLIYDTGVYANCIAECEDYECSVP